MTEVLYAPSTKVSARIIDGQLIILKPGSDQLLRFNAVATFIWSQLEVQPSSIEKLAASIVETFDVNVDTATSDCQEFIQDMTAQNLIRQCDSNDSLDEK